MYGFVEVEVAEAMNLNYTPYGLSNSTAAIVNIECYDVVFRAMTEYWTNTGMLNDRKVMSVDSDVANLRVILSPFYINIDVLNSITGGAVKESPQYLLMINSGTIDKTNYLEFMRNFRTPSVEAEPLPPPAIEDAATTDTVEKAQALSEEDFEATRVKSVNIMHNTLNTLVRFNSIIAPSEIGDGTDIYSIYSNMSSGSDTNKELVKMSLKFKKSIVMINRVESIRDIHKNINPDIMRECLIIICDPHNFNKAFKISNTEITPSILGMVPSVYYTVFGESVNEEIDEARRTLGSELAEEKISKLIAIEKNSPYHSYDMIFKDTCTNVPFAIKNHNIIYTLFTHLSDEALTARVIKELTRRFDGNVSYDELVKIDTEYKSVLDSKSMKEYVKFSVDSASAVLHELKKKFNTHKEEYEEHLARAMEHGKLMRKFMQNIDVFNHSEYGKEEAEKAKKAYEDLAKLDGVASIDVSEETVNVYTNNIYARDDRTGKLHDIGTFHIKLGILSNKYNTSDSVRITNTKYQICAHFKYH